MFRTITAAVIATLLGAIFVGHAVARRLPTPIDVTGTIKIFDRANHVLTIQVDKPAGVLSIVVPRDCKFIQNSTPMGEQSLQKGARAKIRYVSTIFTGKIAVTIELNPMSGGKRT